MKFKNSFKLGMYMNEDFLAGEAFYEFLSIVKIFNTDQFGIVKFIGKNFSLLN